LVSEPGHVTDVGQGAGSHDGADAGQVHQGGSLATTAARIVRHQPGTGCAPRLPAWPDPNSTWQAAACHVKHPVVVLRQVRDHLQHVSVLQDFSVLVETEDVDSYVVVIAGPRLATVKYDVLAFSDHANDLDALA
jgi:hypothetical protein